MTKVKMTTTTSKVVAAFHSVFGKEALVASFFIPVNPVPASRPKVSKWGTYYGKNYTRWRKEVEQFLNDYLNDHPTHDRELFVIVENFVEPAKTTKRSFPRGDVDNFAKGPLDSITKHTEIWEDDDLIVTLLVTKQFKEDRAGTQVTIYKDE